MKDSLFYSSSTAAASAIVFSIQDIYSVVGIVCTCISVFVLIVNLLFKVYDRIKDRKISKQDISETLDDLEEFAENLKKLDK